MTVVLVTHAMDEAERLCDRIAVIDNGRIVAIDSTTGLIERAAALTRDDGGASRGYGEVAAGRGVTTLEDAFLILTDGEVDR